MNHYPVILADLGVSLVITGNKQQSIGGKVKILSANNALFNAREVAILHTMGGKRLELPTLLHKSA